MRGRHETAEGWLHGGVAGRVEKYVDEAREREAAREAKVEADMDEWWTEATEREKAREQQVETDEEEVGSTPCSGASRRRCCGTREAQY